MNPEVTASPSAIIYNSSTGVVFIKGSGYLTKDFLKGMVHYKLYSLESEVRKESDRLIVKGSINSCTFAKGNMGNFLNKIVQHFIDTCSNVKVQCPQLKGLYTMNCPFQVDQFLPIPILSVLSTNFWEFNVSLNVKLSVNQSMTNLVAARLLGRILQ